MLVTVAAFVASLFCHMGNDPVAAAIATLDLPQHRQSNVANVVDQNEPAATETECTESKEASSLASDSAAAEEDIVEARDDQADVVEVEVTEIENTTETDNVEPAVVVEEESVIEQAPATIVEEEVVVSEVVAETAIEVEADDVAIAVVPKELFVAWPDLQDETKSAILLLIKADQMTQK